MTSWHSNARNCHGVITGAGGGMVFKGSLAVAASTAPPKARAEVLAGFFLGAYVGLSVPVVGLGIATVYASARDVMLVFAALASIAIAGSVRAVIGRSTQATTSRRSPRSGRTVIVSPATAKAPR